MGQVVPAPGSESGVYAPNPGAIVVAIDAGHGGCLDWGVPDPLQRGTAFAEKTMTLGIALALRDRLKAEGTNVVLARDDDQAIAGDQYPPQDCDGPPFRDVNGDGIAGFGPEVPEETLARDELQARLDLANLSRADVLVSIHVNSPSENGATIEIAFSQTFYTDETPWGVTRTEGLARDVEGGVVDALGGVPYERGDRGITAHNFYMVAPPLLEQTAERPNRWAQPSRGALMPAILSEVGSITLPAEADLLASSAGQRRVADGLFAGLAQFLGARPLAARIDPLVPGVDPVPEPVPGTGPPFWAPALPAPTDGRVDLPLRLTNTGVQAWPPGVRLLIGWEASDQPYLAAAPQDLEPLGLEVPALGPGESVELSATIEMPAGPRQVAWLTLGAAAGTFADGGSAPLQMATTPLP